MPDKILELEATMRDRVSDTLRGIKRNVDDLNKSTVNLGTQRKEMAALGQELVNLGRAGGGIQQTTKHLRDFHQQFREVSDRFRETGKSVKEQLMPAFEGLGFGVTTVGSAFTVLLGTMRNVIAESSKMQNFAKLSGFDPDTVRGMASAATAFGLSSDKMLSIMKNFGKEMDKIAGTPGGGGSDLLNRMRHSRGLESLTRDIQIIANNRDIPEAQRKIQGFNRTLEELDKIRKKSGSAFAADIAEQLGFDRETVLLVSQGISVAELALNLQRRMGEEIDPAKITANAVANAKFWASFEGLENAVARGLIDDLTKSTNAIADFMDKNNQKIGDGIVTAVTGLGAAAKEAYTELAPFVTEVAKVMEMVQKFHDQQAAGQRSGDVKPFINLPSYLPGGTGGPLGRYLTDRDVPMNRATGLTQPLTTSLIGGALRSPYPRLYTEQNASTVAGRWPTESGPPLSSGSMMSPLAPRATAPQMFEGEAPQFPSGSLGTGSITGGWRHSTNVEDQRSSEEVIADEESRKGTQDNTTAERDNTDQLRKLIEILSRGNSNATMDFSGGMGAGGQGGAFGAGQGPMFRGPSGGHPSGVGPGTSARPGGVHNAPRGETVVRPPMHPAVVPKHTPGAHETPLAPSTPAPVHTEPQPLPPPDLMPGLQDGGVIKRPSTVVDNATGQAVAQVAENAPEFFVPPDQIQRMTQEQWPSSLPAAVRYNNPAAQYSNQRAQDLYYGSPNFPLHDTPPHKISGFPNPILGMASNMDLYSTSPKFIGQTIDQANTNWSGGYRHSLPGYPGDTVITEAMMHDPKFAIPYFQAMLNAETTGSHPLSDAGMREAFDIKEAGGYDNYYNIHKGLPGAQPSGPGPNTAQSPEALGWKKWPLAGDPGFTKEQQLNRPDYYGGQVTIVGQEGTFQFGTGGTYHGDKAGAGSSAPYGDFYVNPGTATGGVGTDGAKWAWPAYAGYSDNPTGNTVYDPKFGANRPGVEVHAAGGGAPVVKLARPSDVNQILTEGCFGIEHEQWPDFQAKLDAEIKANGPLYLHTRPGADPNTGNAYFTHSKTLDTGFDKFPKAAWNPRTDQAITNQSPGRQIVPSSLQSGLPRGGNIDLSQPGLTSIPGVGGLLGAGAPKTEPAPPASTEPAPAGPAPTPATGAGQQPKHIRLGHGRPAYGWAPGQGGQTNVPTSFWQRLGLRAPGSEQAARAERNYGAVHALHPQWWDNLASDQLRSSPVSDVTSEVGAAYNKFAGSTSRGSAAWNMMKLGLSGPGALWHTTAGRTVSALTGYGRDTANTIADIAGAATTIPVIGGGSSFLGKIGGAVGGAEVAEAITGAGRVGQAAAKASPLFLNPEQGAPPPGGLGGNAEVTHKVEGTGTIRVDVRAPRGTNVNAESSGLFKRVQLNRGQSMEHADERGQISE